MSAIKTTHSETLEIGDRIRMLRLSQKSDAPGSRRQLCAFKSMISKIENDKTVPSMATLVKIAQVLGTTISGLLEKEGWDKTIMTAQKDAEQKLVKTEKGYMIFSVRLRIPSEENAAVFVHGQKNEVVPHLLAHEGEEFVYVLSGSMKMQVGDTEYVLKTGDSLYFNALQKHGIMPISDEVQYLDIFV